MHPRTAILRLWSTRLNAGLGATIALCALLYGIFLLVAVTHAAARADTTARAEALTARLSSLESQYLALERQVNPARASELGLVKPAASATVFADTEAPSLTVGNGISR